MLYAWSVTTEFIAGITGAIIASAAGFLGAVYTQLSIARRELRLRNWDKRAEAYIELLALTAWVEHWYITGLPDKYERPQTVNMARTAAKVSAFGNEEDGRLAYRLMEQLAPEVSRQDISRKAPPHDTIRQLANDLTTRAHKTLNT